MSAMLESSLWYRVADLRPKLRPHARLHRHRYRGQIWYLLEDPASGRVNRFTPAARLVIALMDGSRRVSELWEMAQRRQGEAAPTQDDMIQLLGQLHAADLLQTDVTPDTAELFARGEREDRARTRRSYGNPMAIRLPLWDPDTFLTRISPFTDLIWSRPGLLLWLAVVVPAALLIPQHWPELSNNFTDRVMAVDNLFILYLVFPVLKALHELGHATAIKARGGAVHDLGLIFLVMLPVPYVEASAAIVFKSKLQRAAVGAAGVGVELFVAALAFYGWLTGRARPGPRGAIQHDADRGRIHADLQRQSAVALRRLLRAGGPDRDAEPGGARATLLALAAAARAVRPARGATGGHPGRGGLAAGLRRCLHRVPADGDGVHRAVHRRAVLFRGCGAGDLGGGDDGAAGRAAGPATSRPARNWRRCAPVPSRSRAAGRALLALFLDVRADAGLHQRAGCRLAVRAGGGARQCQRLPGPLCEPAWRAQIADTDELVVLADPELGAKIAVSQGRLTELEAAYTAEAGSDRVKADVARKQVESERANLAALRQRSTDLVVRARTAGVFVAAQGADMSGRYYHKGDLLGWVIGPTPPVVRVAVLQDAVDRVRLDADRVRVRLLGHGGRVASARIVRTVPGGEEYLPSRAMASENGGDIPTDPRDTTGRPHAAAHVPVRRGA